MLWSPEEVESLSQGFLFASFILHGQAGADRLPILAFQILAYLSVSSFQILEQDTKRRPIHHCTTRPGSPALMPKTGQVNWNTAFTSNVHSRSTITKDCHALNTIEQTSKTEDPLSLPPSAR